MARSVTYPIQLLTLFPSYFEGPLSTSILGRARKAGVAGVRCVDIRDFASTRHRRVDDTPYGGGAGMVMRAPELAAATDWSRARAPGAPVIYLSPQGAPFRQSHARWLAEQPGMVLVCGRYEGVDERWIERHVDLEISVGDFVLTGGEAAAVCVVDAVVRLLPGALGNAASASDESFSHGMLEYPQFTRPATFEGLEVPDVLLSGDHGRISAWREKLSLARTSARRPDLLEGAAPEVEDGEAWLVKKRHVEDEN